MTKIDLSKKEKELETMRSCVSLDRRDFEKQITELKTQCKFVSRKESQTDKDIESEVTKLILSRSKEGTNLKQQLNHLKSRMVNLKNSN
jgi:hypothetical protein